jgi:DNA processing protein
MSLPNKPSLLSNTALWALQTQLTAEELQHLRLEICNHEISLNPKILKILNSSAKGEGSAHPTQEAPRNTSILSCWDLETLLPEKNFREIPLALAARGNPAILKAPKVAIIGSRHPTYYGREQAHRFAQEIAKAGITVLSGGAIGIDTIANQAAFDAGSSCAILGSGLAEPYPSSNEHMFARMGQSTNGLVLSEFGHHTTAFKWNFPRRNRTIAALADFILVIEATPTSGSILTVKAAHDVNCDVGALPGPIDSPTSDGTNILIRDGAFCILRPSDVIERVHAIARLRNRKSG